jgi:protocatechuate 3,4-dioxygenase beta subunit
VQKNALIGVIVAIGAVVVIAPLGYAFAQRAAIASLDFDFDRFELTDIDFSETQSFGSMQRIVANAEDPSLSMMNDFDALQSSIVTPETFALDLIANTRLTYSMFVNIHNPSPFEAVIDRAQVIMSINGQNLANPLLIDQQYRIGPGQTVQAELKGISVNGKEIAGVLFNLASDDFILTIDFAITSYFPTLLGDASVPANVNVQMFLIPPKPAYVSFEDPYGSGIQQVSFQPSSDIYKLSFTNQNGVPISGKFEVGVLKGNEFLSGVGLCDPTCIAPMDNGFATFMRIKGSSVFDVEVFASPNLNLENGDTYTLDIADPVLRSNANSAYIMRWAPDYEKVPYIIKSSVAGIQKSSSGEFESGHFAIVRNVAYNIVNNFGYVGSQEFVSPDKSTYLTLRSSDYDVEEGDSITFSGKLTDSYGRGIPDMRIVIMEGDPIGDDFIAQGNADDSGEFDIRWMAEDLDDFDNEQDIYATFSGNSHWEKSASSEIKVEVSSSGSTYQPPSSEPELESTSLSLYASSYSVYEGDTVSVNGRLIDQEGNGIASRTIILKQDRSFDFDPEITSGQTNSGGFYTFDMTFPAEGIYTLYTIFEGSASYDDARSNEIQIEVYASEEQQQAPQQPEYESTTITMQVSSEVVNEGDTVTISGYLTDQYGNGISLARIDIKDEDTGSGDDLLGTVYTTGFDGFYSFHWQAEPNDPFDNIVEIYAVFEGSQNYPQARSVQINVHVN